MDATWLRKAVQNSELGKSRSPVAKPQPQLANVSPADKSDPGSRLHLAAAKGEFAAVKEILANPALTKDQRKQLVEHRDAGNFNRTALMQASRNGHLAVVNFLVREMEADIFARDTHELGSMAVHFAAEWGRLEVLHFLTDFNADLVEAKNTYGATPLNLAAFAGQFKIVEFLVDEKKANLENKGALDRTPIMSAAEQGHLEIVDFLEKRGADLFAKSCIEANEDLAIHLASYFGHVKVVETLLESKPALLEARNKTNETPLNRAAIGGQIRVVEFLVEIQKANLENRGEFMRTPVMQAADEGHGRVVDYLAKHGANLLAKDNQNGDTALHLAAYFNQVKVVEVLLDLNDATLVQSTNNQGNTPYALAKRQNNAEAVDLFHKRGIKN